MPDRHAYKCLPMKIANSFGWQLLCPITFQATWNGEGSRRAVRIEGVPSESEAPFVESKFGNGILSFWPGIMLRTEEPLDLFVTGPLNVGKDGIHPLTAVVESSWLPAQLPMNWRFTRPGTVCFEAGEPYCHFFPIDLRHVADAEPSWQDIAEDPELLRQFEEWRKARGLAKLDAKHRQCPYQFQKYYHQGCLPSGRHVATHHYSHLRPRPFATSIAGTGTDAILPDGVYTMLWSVLHEHAIATDSGTAPPLSDDR